MDLSPAVTHFHTDLLPGLALDVVQAEKHLFTRGKGLNILLDLQLLGSQGHQFLLISLLQLDMLGRQGLDGRAAVRRASSGHTIQAALDGGKELMLIRTLGDFKITVEVVPTGKAASVWGQPMVICVRKDYSNITSVQNFRSAAEMEKYP